MNEKKLKLLFTAARNETVPLAPADFADDVLRAVQREPMATIGEKLSIFDQLNLLFPRVVLAAAAVIAICVALDFGLTMTSLPGLGDGAAQVSSQFLFPAEDL